MVEEEEKSIKQTLLNRLLSADAKESSKRALAIYVVIVLGTGITVVALVNDVDYIFLLGTWLAYAAALLGMSEYNKNVRVRKDAEVKIEKEKVKSITQKESKIVDDGEIN